MKALYHDPKTKKTVEAPNLKEAKKALKPKPKPKPRPILKKKEEEKKDD